jgi:hypothetical protein
LKITEGIPCLRLCARGKYFRDKSRFPAVPFPQQHRDIPGFKNREISLLAASRGFFSKIAGMLPEK